MPPAKPRVVKPCAICGTLVSRLPCQIKGLRLYCSKECVGAAKRHGSEIVCAHCGASVYRRFGEQDRGERVRSFCSRPCRDRFRAINRKANVYPKTGARHVHRLVAEAVLGRKLAPGEVVHHMDDDKHNNAPSNLAVFPTQADHVRCHRGKMTRDELRRYMLKPN